MHSCSSDEHATSLRVARCTPPTVITHLVLVLILACLAPCPSLSITNPSGSTWLCIYCMQIVLGGGMREPAGCGFFVHSMCVR